MTDSESAFHGGFKETNFGSLSLLWAEKSPFKEIVSQDENGYNGFQVMDIMRSGLSEHILYSLRLYFHVVVSPSAAIVLCEDICFVYPAMSMVGIGPSLLYHESRWNAGRRTVCCMMFIDSYWRWYAGLLELDRKTWTQFRIRIVLFSFEQRTMKNQRIDEKENQTTKWINSRTTYEISERQ